MFLIYVLDFPTYMFDSEHKYAIAYGTLIALSDACSAPYLSLENILLECQNSQLINTNEVTDFHNGFLTIFSALRSNTRWTTELMNIHICVENIDNFMGFFNNILLEEYVDYSLIFMRSWYSVGFSNIFV